MMANLSATAPQAHHPTADGGGGGGGTLTVTVLTVACAALAFIVLLMSAVDLPYFLRTLCGYVSATWFKKRLRPTDTAVYASACLTTDLDVYMSHMNNARYLREIDLARIEFLLRTGIWRELRSRGGFLFTIANNVRYRKFIRTFARYQIRTRIVYWDDVSIFFEYRFVTVADGFVRSIVYNRQRVVNCGADELMRAAVGAASKTADGGGTALQKPECPLEIHHWIQSNLMSSANLRAENGCADGGIISGVVEDNGDP